MGNSLRFCLGCVLPCGALDLIRVVHLNGYVEEITHPITAGEVLKANPNHVLSKPSSQGVVRKIMIVSPDTELKRGTIYFLIPTAEKKKSTCENVSGGGGGDGTGGHHHHRHRRQRCEVKNYCSSSDKIRRRVHVIHADDDLSTDQYDRYLTVVVSEKNSSSSSSSSSRRRNGRVGAWRPHLQSISED